MPDINLDVFKMCSCQRWRLGELLYINIAISFGVFSSPDLGSSDVPYLILPASWYRRSPRVLDRFDHSQEIKDEQIPGHSEHLGHHRARCDDTLCPHVYQSIRVPALLVFCPSE